MDLKKATILDAIGEGLFVVDLEGRIRFWNRWISTYTKQEPKAVIGKRLDEVFPEVNQDRLSRFEASEAEQKKLFLDQLTGLHSRSKMLQDLPIASKPLLAIFSVDL